MFGLRAVRPLADVLALPCKFVLRKKSWISKMSAIKYPQPRREEVHESLHGRQIHDPYRWMEDPDAEETREFVENQNKVSKAFIAKNANREKINAAMTKLWNYPKFSSPSKQGDNYYYHHNTGLQNQYVMYTMKKIDDEPEVFLDPNGLSADGTVSLSKANFSESGKFFLYGLSESGSDWSTLYVKNVDTKEDLNDKIERVRYTSTAWTHDDKGFFYGQYPDWTGKVTGTEAKAVEHQKIYYHRLNTPQSEDILCYENASKPHWMYSPEVSDCGKYLIVTVGESCDNNMILVADISAGVSGLLNMKTVYGEFDCDLEFIANNGEVFFFRTNKGRPQYAIVKIDIQKPEEIIEVIPEHPKDVLSWVSCVAGDKFVVGYTKDVVSIVNVYSMEGAFLQNIPFDIGSISCSGERKLSEVFFSFTSFLTPTIIYRSEIDKAPKATIEKFKSITLDGVSTDDLEVKQHFFSSQDGTKVPMFVMRKKDSPMDGKSPCLLYIYGGFNISLHPSFSIYRLMLVKKFGFTVAVANVRGGGEYGKTWHEAGILKNKQNTLDDVHAAAAFLADEGFTSAERLAVNGGSNGGFVVTSSINQRPELFGAAVAQVPVTDMLRFHKFTIGRAWCSDYGNSENADDFEFQIKVSPLHNIPSGIDNYPSLLVTTGDHDDRVVPSHSLKFIAEVQHRLGGSNKNPLLVLIDTKAGHGAGKPTTKVIEELTDIMSFLQLTLKADYIE